MSKFRLAALAAFVVAGLLVGFTQAAPTFASPPPPCSIHTSGGATGTAYCSGNNTSVNGQANGVAAVGGLAVGAWIPNGNGYTKNSAVVISTGGGNAAVTAVTGEDHPVVVIGASSGTGTASIGGVTGSNGYNNTSLACTGGGVGLVYINGVVTFCP
jgi:hypothetical protein